MTTMIQELKSQIRIIDNFYDEPDRIRDLALQARFKTPRNTERGNGVAFGARCCELSFKLMVNQFRERLSQHILIDPKLTMFRYSTADTSAKTVCHTDDYNPNIEWSTIIYLTLPRDCQGGTSFFRHRPTGKLDNSRPFDWNKANAMDPAEWEEAGQVDMAYNRCIMFRPSLFHSVTPPFFGHSRFEGRLTQVQMLMRSPDFPD